MPLLIEHICGNEKFVIVTHNVNLLPTYMPFVKCVRSALNYEIISKSFIISTLLKNP